MQVYEGYLPVGGNFVKIADSSPRNGEYWLGTEAELAALDAGAGRDENTLYVTVDGGSNNPIGLIRTGDGVPSNALGNDTDFYLDNLTGTYYVKTGGVYVEEGSLKGPGNDGTKIYYGTGLADPQTGVDGDFYIDDNTGTMYVKELGTWNTFKTLKGADGNKIHQGSGVPSNILGIDGDIYINTDNWDLYQRQLGQYNVIGNIKGADGAPGADGASITSGTFVPQPKGSTSGAYAFSGTCKYRKIGDLVTLNLPMNSITGNASGTFRVGNLPFNIADNDIFAVSVGNAQNVGEDTYSILAYLGKFSGQAEIQLKFNSVQGDAISQNLPAFDTSVTGVCNLWLTVTYITNE